MTRQEMEQLAAGIGKGLAKHVPDGLAFTFILADFGDGGSMAYLSNAERADIVKMLREMADKLDT